ncbi:MAG: TRAP transporter substrate-binding protein DctP [Desulfotignum sp.]|nr:TRAP transporter substrate-binding protein DctP [Desulfotignum sp.]
MIHKLAITISIVLAGFFLLNTTCYAGSKTITWKVCFHTMVQKGNWAGNIMENWAKEIEERTNGDLKIQFYWPGALPYKGAESLMVMKKGLADVIEGTTWSFTGLEPTMDVSLQIFMYNDKEETKKAMEEVLMPHWEPKFKKYNAKVLMHWTSGAYQNYWSKEPVTKLSQMKGVKTRVYSRGLAEMVKMWGSAPLTIPVVELYTALQRGIVSAVITSNNTAYDIKFWEVLDYSTEIKLMPGGPDTLLVNQKSWGKLSPETQAVVMEVSKKYSAVLQDEVWNSAEQIKEKLKENGMEILQISKEEREKIKDLTAGYVWKDYLAKAGDDGVAIFKDLEKCLGRPLLEKAGY